MAGMNREGNEKHGSQSRLKEGFYLKAIGGMEPSREAGGQTGKAYDE